MPEPDPRRGNPSAPNPSTPDYLGREDRAVQLLARCIGDIVGVRSDAYRTLARASASDNPLDLHLAQAAFETLDPAVRRQIHDRVRELGARPVRPTGPAA